ncbi:MAG: hypothetical protein B0W54_23510 [Cellvibrio sp. 79]|nr:MAG: hypothetical protein B0W54_23510 [Cellvibrio sp. 79]
MTELQDVPPTENPPPNIRRELASLIDSYREFHHYCAFYCKSTSVMLHRFGVDLDADCTEGIERVAQMVMDKADDIEARLKRVMDRV